MKPTTLGTLERQRTLNVQEFMNLAVVFHLENEIEIRFVSKCRRLTACEGNALSFKASSTRFKRPHVSPIDYGHPISNMGAK